MQKKTWELKTKFWKNLMKDAIEKDTETENEEEMPEKWAKNIKKIIPLSKIKKNYSRFEQQRELAASYDLFLCDKSILENMPQALGR